MPSMRSGATMAAEEAASGEETPFTASMASANEDAASAGSRATAAASERSTTRCAASVAAASTCGAMCISVSAASEPSAAAGATSARRPERRVVGIALLPRLFPSRVRRTNAPPPGEALRRRAIPACEDALCAKTHTVPRAPQVMVACGDCVA